MKPSKQTHEQASVDIHVQSAGFYAGINRYIAVVVKILIGLIVLGVLYDPSSAETSLRWASQLSFEYLNGYYTYSVAGFLLTCVVIGLHPRWGKITLGEPNQPPEFSNFSWFAMMFGAGIGIGMIGYAVAEPLWHFNENPDILAAKAGLLDSQIEPQSHAALASVYRYTFFHWGLGAWACYAIVGLALAYTSYVLKGPLTMRATLAPMLGRCLSGPVGHWVDIFAIVATLLGVAQTIGLGLYSFTFGLHNVTKAPWLLDGSTPSLSALLLSLVVIIGCSLLSAISGVGRGIKWLSNINIGLSWIFLGLFAVFGAFSFAIEWMIKGLWHYLSHFPSMSVTVWEAGTPRGDWQIDWSVFYWAWWIAFSPFVGFFLARISKHRTIREFLFSAIIAPSLMCFLWFTLVGGTAINIELNGSGNGTIFNADLTAQLYELINQVFDPAWGVAVSGMVVLLLLTYLITSSDSAILVMNIISAGGTNPKQKQTQHCVMWALVLTALISALLVAGGLNALKIAMILGAIPFSLMMLLMVGSLFRALARQSR